MKSIEYEKEGLIQVYITSMNTEITALDNFSSKQLKSQ